MLILKILGLWFALSIILTPVLVPTIARRFRKHDEWIKASEKSRWQPSVTPQVRVLRPRQPNNRTGGAAR